MRGGVRIRGKKNYFSYCIRLKLGNTLSFLCILTLRAIFFILNFTNLNDLLLLVSLYSKKLNPRFLTKNEKSGCGRFHRQAVYYNF